MRLLIAAMALLAGVCMPVAAPARAAELPGFQDTMVLSGLDSPTVVRFSPDGRVFVGEKSGLIKVFDNLRDRTPTIFADLRTETHNFEDRGLLGLALPPNFPTNPSVYVLYTYDAVVGGTAPRWGTVGGTVDDCPDPPGANNQGCVVTGRLSKLTAKGNVATGPEQVLITDWCQQFRSHSIGDVRFGPDGQLYVSGGDGASFSYSDYGQTGNPCGDPPLPAGTNLSPPTAEGGALRAQAVRRPPGEPVSLDGSLLRLDPATGAASAFNPFSSDVDANRRRVVAYGMRNPFRFTFRPGTSEVWIGDVGYRTWEEIDRLVSPTSPATNFGWPCYEGEPRASGFDSLNLNQCESLYAAGTAAGPYYSYNHSANVVAGESCPTGTSSITGLAFYDRAHLGGNYPAAYDDALFFADHSRNCIWAMRRGSNGLPDPSNIQTFEAPAGNPVDLEIGPGGDLYYVDIDGGAIHRIQYTSASNAPNTPPVPVIDSPGATLTWKAGDAISFTGHATDAEDGAVPASRLHWDVIDHCPSNCHTHTRRSFEGVAGGSFSAPDQKYPSYVELRLTATDSSGLAASTSVDLQPRTVDLNLKSVPSGLRVSTAYGTRTTPYTQTVIAASSNLIRAKTPQSLGGKKYAFASWSDGGAATHRITAPDSGSATYTARFTETTRCRRTRRHRSGRAACVPAAPRSRPRTANPSPPTRSAHPSRPRA